MARLNRLAPLWCVLCVACGGDDDPAGFDFERFRAAMETAQCDRMVRCHRIAESSACTPLLRRELERLRLVLARGGTSFHPAAALRCAEQVTALDCSPRGWGFFDRYGGILDLVNAGAAACDEVFTGATPDQAPCFVDGECAGGRCVVDREDCSGCCPGYCGRIPGPDEPCFERGVQCGPATLCLPEGGCGPLLADGAPCQAGYECGVGRGCVDVAGQDQQVCQPLADHGEPCDDSVESFPCLRADDVCDPDSRRCVTRLDVGAPCGLDRWSGCLPLATCSGDGICVPLEPPGGRCGADRRCEVGLECVDGTCMAPGSACHCGDGVPDPGEACDDGNIDPGDGCSPTCTLEP